MLLVPVALPITINLSIENTITINTYPITNGTNSTTSVYDTEDIRLHRRWLHHHLYNGLGQQG